MSVKFKYLKETYKGEDINDLVRIANVKSLPQVIIDKLLVVLRDVNKPEDTLKDGDDIFIPILPMYFKNYRNLLTAEQILSGELPKPEPEPEPKPEPKPEPIILEEPEEEKEEQVFVKKIPKPTPKFIEVPTGEIDHLPDPVPMGDIKPKKIAKLLYKTYPYTFSRPNETIEAVLRLYNDMNMSQPVLKKLVYEFVRNNKDALPPKLGQTVQVPVLKAYAKRHEQPNDNT